MSELRALMREDDDTASTGSEDPDAEDRATVTTVTIGDLDIVTQEATHAFGRARADQSGNVVWGAAGRAERIGGRAPRARRLRARVRVRRARRRAEARRGARRRDGRVSSCIEARGADGVVE